MNDLFLIAVSFILSGIFGGIVIGWCAFKALHRYEIEAVERMARRFLIREAEISALRRASRRVLLTGNHFQRISASADDWNRNVRETQRR